MVLSWILVTMIQLSNSHRKTFTMSQAITRYNQLVRAKDVETILHDDGDISFLVDGWRVAIISADKQSVSLHDSANWRTSPAKRVINGVFAVFGFNCDLVQKGYINMADKPVLTEETFSYHPNPYFTFKTAYESYLDQKRYYAIEFNENMTEWKARNAIWLIRHNNGNVEAFQDDMVISK